MFCFSLLTSVALVSLGQRLQAGSLIDQVVDEAKPASVLAFLPASGHFLPGKGRGTPEESLDGLGIALVFAQNNYWRDSRWSAEGYTVLTGELSDAMGRTPSTPAWRVSTPQFASSFEFIASGNSLFFRFPKPDDYVVYSLPDDPLGLGVSSRKAVEEARIPRDEVVVDGFTPVPGVRLDQLEHPRIFFYRPASSPLQTDTKTTSGVGTAQDALTPLGSVTTMRVDVSAYGTPENSLRDGRRPGEVGGARPSLTTLPDPDGGVTVVWQDTRSRGLRVTRIGPDLVTETMPLPRSLGRVSNVVRDGEGNLFYVSYSPGANPQVLLVKTRADGEELIVRSQSTRPGDLDIATMSDHVDSVHLALAEERLGAVYARGMHNGHQGSIVASYDPASLDLLRNHGQNSSHSFDSRIVADGPNFLNLSLGDNYPRGLALHRIAPSAMRGRVVYTYKTKHYPSGTASNDNRTYTEIGDLVPGSEGIGLVFASEPGTDNADAVNAINESRNLGYLLVAPDFTTIGQSGYVVPWEMIRTEGSDSPRFGFYDFGGRFVPQQYRGVRWLTDYSDLQTENASRPKMVALEDGTRLILWEKWTPDRHVSTHGVRIDALGNPLGAPVHLGGLRLSDGDSLVREGTRVHGVVSDGTNLLWSVIETDLASEKLVKVLSSVFDVEEGTVRFAIERVEGMSYHIETSTDLQADSWTPVESIPLEIPILPGPTTPVFVLTTPLVADSDHRFWRVVAEYAP